MSGGSTPAILLVGAIILIFFLLAACAIVAFLYLSPAPTGGGTGGGGTGGPGGAGNGSSQGGNISLNTTTANISAEDMALWDSITLANVETACLIRAKEEAGGSEGMVYSCDCKETVRAVEKSYECGISTADPFTDYFANIECTLESRSCAVETNYGTVNVSFSELRTYYSQ